MKTMLYRLCMCKYCIIVNLRFPPRDSSIDKKKNGASFIHSTITRIILYLFLGNRLMWFVS